MSLKFKVSASLTVLGLLACALSFSHYFSARKQEIRFHEAKETACVIDDLLIAGDAWAVERSATFAALNDANPVSNDDYKTILAFRKKGEVAFMRVLTKMHAMEAPEFKGMLDEAEKAFERMEDLRSLVGTNLVLPLYEREPALFTSWIPAACDQIDKSQAMRFALTERAIQLDPKLGAQAQLRHFAWLMTEFVRRERVIIGAILTSGQEMSFGTIEKLGLLRGRFEVGRNTLDRLKRTSSERVRIAVDASEQRIANEFQNLRSAILAAGINNQPYTVNSTQWNAGAEIAIRSILAIQKASTEESQGYINRNGQSLNLATSFAFYLFVFTFGFVLFASNLIIRGVLLPLSELAALSGEIAGGSLEVGVPHAGGADEIGQVANGLKNLKDALQEKQGPEKKRRNGRKQPAVRAEEPNGSQTVAILQDQDSNESDLGRAA